MNHLNFRRWNNRGLVRKIQSGCLVIALFALLVFAARNREAVISTLEVLRFGAALRTGSILLALHFLVVLAFHALHRALGLERPLQRAAISYFQRLPGRFLPGGIWHSVLRYADMHTDQPIPARFLGTIFAGESLLVAGSGLSAAGVLGLLFANPGFFNSAIATLMIAIGLVFVMGLLVICFRITSYRAWRLVATSLALMSSIWIASAIAFATLASDELHWTFTQCSVGAVAASYLGAASVGYVAVFAPQGWGVTELALATLQPCDIQAASLIALVFGYRVISLCTDVIAYTATIALPNLFTTAERKK